ncbi:MAG: twin-arginine translocase subunit TatC [Deltaproteobacteria bacterium]|nr:twin-arginine translocase subunit TatC [Deltaproteobacteria bacterium]
MAEHESGETAQAQERSGDPYLAAGASPGELGPAAPAGEPDRPDEKRMSFVDHLSELRTRLRNAALALLLATIASFVFVEKYFDWLTRPVRLGLRDAGHEMNFYARSLTEPFWVYMKLALVGGLLVSAPFVFWELWRFIAPGLYRKERRIGVIVSGSAAVCFAGGAVFAYAFLCQPAAYFLTKLCKTFAGDLPFKLDTMLMMEDVANFQMLTLAGTGLAFELPVVLAILGWIGIVSSRSLLRFDKYALVLAFLVGALVTPSGDPFTQTLLALPVFALYNLSILVVWLLERAQRKRDAALSGVAT